MTEPELYERQLKGLSDYGNARKHRIVKTIILVIVIAWIVVNVFHMYQTNQDMHDLKHDNYKLEKRIVQLETAY